MPSTPGPLPPPPPLDDEPPAPEAPARPAWRSVVKRPEPGPRRKGKAAAAAPPPPPPPPPAMEAPRPELPSWAQWRREYAFILPFVIVLTDSGSAANPNVHPVVRGPTPSSQAVVQAPPPRQGLFGACSPRCLCFSSILTHTQDL
jgi:hypothetical protein